MTPSSGLPMLKSRDPIRALERMGFCLPRKSKGSHWQFEHRGWAARHYSRSSRARSWAWVIAQDSAGHRN
jgi:hypothetical protein